MTIFEKLAKPFNPDKVSWRQGAKGYLAYIDARDVMERLDSVLGPMGWSDSYFETPKGRVICELTIFIDDEGFPKEVTKSDGAGETSFEGEKGAISDAFKRAAVKWGIGRYLYDLPVVESKAAGREILIRQYSVMQKEDAMELARLMDAADLESGEGVAAFGEAWLELDQDEQMGFGYWIPKLYPNEVTKAKGHMRSVVAAYRQMNGES